MNSSDIQLIALFTKQGDQAAFARLVDRYVDVAYAAAITYLGKDDLARDACQLTFVELARKAASLSANVKFGGWVYTTSRNISRKIQRGEMRRLKREQDYADQMKLQNSPEVDWTRLTPEIHSALDQLKPADRDSIILRYFQHKSLSETGAALGLSADAARMRLNRALERLNKQLAHKGITSTATALAAALPVHAASMAPAGLAKSISVTALASAGTATIGISTLTGLGIMSTKTLIITASVAATTLLGGGVYFANQVSTTSADRREPATTNPATTPREQPVVPAMAPEKTVEATTATAIAAPNTPLASAPSKNTSSDAITSLDDPRAAIGSKRLKEAEQLLSIMQFAMSMGGSENIEISMDGMTEETDVLVKKLSLRLGLTEEQQLAFQEILEESKREAVGPVDPQALLEGILEMDRKKASEFLALQMMEEQGEPLTPELQSYNESLQLEVAKELGINPEDFESEPPPPWDRNDAVLDKLYAQLAPQQQKELSTYVGEQEIREKEQQTLLRSSQLANQLGLNEEDRGALYDYLYENPDATQEDISDNLAPELRELLK